MTAGPLGERANGQRGQRQAAPEGRGFDHVDRRAVLKRARRCGRVSLGSGGGRDCLLSAGSGVERNGAQGRSGSEAGPQLGIPG